MASTSPEGNLLYVHATTAPELQIDIGIAVPPSVERSRYRFGPTGEEYGTPLADRPFRPDVQGLRALAVALVVLYHAGVPLLSGGFVGVDVFFVISGFVITGLLLRERAVEGRTNLLGFYARRARRILPAATLVIVVTVVASYHWLAFVRGAQVAADARAAALFWANFHFIALGTNYTSASQPPSPLQNFWSLAVEEQFYLVYPTLFILAACSLRRFRLSSKLTALLVAACAVSYWWSIHQTAQDATAAYFSPFTRAWELGLGALVAVLTPRLRRAPRAPAALAGWIGLAAIVFAATRFGAQTAYPGWVALLPVGGTALAIGAGAAVPARGPESVLRLWSFQRLGDVSYSLYLWHWPLLAIATQQATTPLPLADRLGWIGVALAISISSYLVVENPVRRSRRLAAKPWVSLAIGGGLVGSALAVITVVQHVYP